MRWHEIGEAFGVRRPGAAFSALHFGKDLLDPSDSFSDSKAGKAAPGRRTPKASPASRDLIAFKQLLFAHSSGNRPVAVPTIQAGCSLPDQRLRPKWPPSPAKPPATSRAK